MNLTKPPVFGNRL